MLIISHFWFDLVIILQTILNNFLIFTKVSCCTHRYLELTFLFDLRNFEIILFLNVTMAHFLVLLFLMVVDFTLQAIILLILNLRGTTW